MVSGKTLLFVAGVAAIAWSIGVLPSGSEVDTKKASDSEEIVSPETSLPSREPQAVPQKRIVPVQNQETSSAAPNPSQRELQSQQAPTDPASPSDDSYGSSNEDPNAFDAEETHRYRPGAASSGFEGEEFYDDPMAEEQVEGEFETGMEGDEFGVTGGTMSGSTEESDLGLDAQTQSETGGPQTGAGEPPAQPTPDQQTWTSGGSMLPPVGTPTPAPEASPSGATEPAF